MRIKSRNHRRFGHGGVEQDGVIAHFDRLHGMGLEVTARVGLRAGAYWYDPGQLQTEWDRTHASWLARVREGIRFPWANQRDAQLALLDAGSASIRMSGNLLLPAWTEATRLEVLSDGSNVNISQTTHTVVDVVRREIARQVVEYGPTVTVCENQAEWAMTFNQSVGELFTHTTTSIDRRRLGCLPNI